MSKCLTSAGGNPCTQFHKKMYYEKRQYKTTLENVPKDAGESIEEMLRRLTANKEPIPENVPPIYTPKDAGVLPDYDIRADRFDVAYEATDKFNASEIAKSAEKAVEPEESEQGKEE